MGVMYCNRNGCEEVMCIRHSNEHGYICHECFDQLVSRGPGQDIEAFMDSAKSSAFDTKEAYKIYASVFTIDRQF